MMIIFGLVGLALGSFGNVLLYRIAHDEDFGGRSHCPHCDNTIAWFDLIPVLSFILLLGRCRKCKKSISIGYPLVELLTASLFVLSAWIYPQNAWTALLTALIVWNLLLIAVYDMRHKQIPDLFTGIIAFAAVLLIYIGNTALIDALRGLGISVLWFGLLWLGSRGRAVGTGDLLLGAALGLWLGLFQTIVMLLLSYIIGAFVILTMLLFRLLPRKSHQKIAFGPFLASGALLAFLGAGEWYLRMLGI